MTIDETVAQIDGLLEAGVAASSESGLGVTLKLEALKPDVFEAYADRYDAHPQASKCACGHCGNLVLTFDVPLASPARIAETAEECHVFALFVRQATEDETVELLERMVEAS